jgi:hypothetical protein
VTLPANLGPRTLRDLGWALIARANAIEEADPDLFVRRRRELTPAGVERLAELVTARLRPSIGFWVRHSGPVDATLEEDAA